MKVWFVTGASRGFGALIAKHALARGDAVIATSRRSDDIRAALGEHLHRLDLDIDVTNEEAVRVGVAAGVARFGQIDVLVNNAGMGLVGAVEEVSASEVERLFSVNVGGLLNVTRAVLPRMRVRRSGHILNMSSMGGYRAHRGWGIYNASKFAVEGLSEAMAQEVAPLGIHVTLVEPGSFRTHFLDDSSLGMAQKIIDDYAGTSGATRAYATQANFQQPGDPEKLAEALMTIVGIKNPPLRLALGSDAVRNIETKNAEVSAELEAWRAVSLATDYVR